MRWLWQELREDPVAWALLMLMWAGTAACLYLATQMVAGG